MTTTLADRDRLHVHAEARWRNRCPVCYRVMTPTVNRPGKSDPSTMRTRGHNQAVAHGGNSLEWLFMCRRCNNDQGWLSFAAFARMLILHEDKRAERVAEVARFVADWRARAYAKIQ